MQSPLSVSYTHLDVYKRQDKSQIHIGTVLYQIVYSTCVDLFANCHIYSTYKWINFLIMLLGVVLFAVGTGLYASASLGRGSYEAVTFALAEKNHWQIKFVDVYKRQ